MLGTFPFELWFKSYCWFTEWSLEVLEISNRTLSHSSSSLLCFSPPPTDSAARRRRGEPSRPPLCFALAPTRRAAPPSPPVASRLSLPGRATRPAEPRTVPAAATATPPWRACCRVRRPLFARARALQKPQQANPFALSLAPRFQTPEHAAAPP